MTACSASRCRPARPTRSRWLAGQTAGARTYWRGRGEIEARAGSGVALAVDARSLTQADLAGTLALLPAGARLTTTARFDPAAETGREWEAFGAARFVLPRIEFRSDGRTASLAVHLAPGETAATARQAIASLRPADDRPASALPLPFMRRDDPDRADWGRMLRWAFGAFETGALDKVVLARRARFLFDDRRRRLRPARAAGGRHAALLPRARRSRAPTSRS